MEKLSYRDQIIITVVLVILIGVAGYMLLIKPKYEDIQTTQAELETAQEEWDELESKIQQINSIKERIQTKYDECVQLGNFFVDVKRSNTLDEFIRGYFVKNAIYIKSTAGYTDASITTLAPYSLSTQTLDYNIGNSANLNQSDETTEENTDSQSAIEPQSLPFGTTSIDFTATRASLMQFLEDIRHSGKTIEVKSLSLDSGSYSTDMAAILTGNLSIDVYYADMISDLDIAAEIEAVK